MTAASAHTLFLILLVIDLAWVPSITPPCRNFFFSVFAGQQAAGSSDDLSEFINNPNYLNMFNKVFSLLVMCLELSMSTISSTAVTEEASGE